MSDDNNNNKSPRDQFREGIKAAVNVANRGLDSLAKGYASIKEPMSSVTQKVEESSAAVFGGINTCYKNRHQYPVEIIGGTSLVSGLFFIRRGRVATALGAAVGGASAYAIVYDEISLENLEKIPSLVFGRKDE